MPTKPTVADTNTGAGTDAGKKSTEPPEQSDGENQNAVLDDTTEVEETKLKRVAPAGVPIPSKGWRAKWYWINVHIRRRPNIVPKLSKKEQQAYDAEVAAKEAAQAAVEAEAQRLAQEAEAEAQRRAQTAKSIADSKELATEVDTAVVVFIGVKGAAATTATAVFEASVFAEDTRSVLVVLDANPAAGDSAARLGKDYSDTLSIQQLATALDERERSAESLESGENVESGDSSKPVDSFRGFIRKIRPTRYSVRAITAESIVDGDNRVPEEKVRKLLKVTRGLCEYLFVDTANDITEPVTLAVVEAADVLIFTANVKVSASLKRLATSMETLRKRGFEEKVNNGVVVISNLPAGADLEYYRKYLNRVNIADEVIEEYKFDGPFLGIPHDPEIARDGEVNLEVLQWATREAYRQLGIAWLGQVALARHTTIPHDPSAPPDDASRQQIEGEQT